MCNGALLKTVLAEVTGEITIEVPGWGRNGSFPRQIVLSLYANELTIGRG